MNARREWWNFRHALENVEPAVTIRANLSLVTHIPLGIAIDNAVEQWGRHRPNKLNLTIRHNQRHVIRHYISIVSPSRELFHCVYLLDVSHCERGHHAILLISVARQGRVHGFLAR